jgi:hypothetical protein
MGDPLRRLRRPSTNHALPTVYMEAKRKVGRLEYRQKEDAERTTIAKPHDVILFVAALEGMKTFAGWPLATEPIPMFLRNRYISSSRWSCKRRP